MAEDHLARLKACHEVLIKQRREYADALDSEGAAKIQLQIEALKKAMIDETPSPFQPRAARGM